MMFSYSTSDYFFSWLSVESSLYLDWALYDYATVGALLSVYLLLKKTTPSFMYLLIGLIVNSLLSLCMYLDMYVYNNREPWFLWDLYTFSVNIIDLIMIVILIVDRDLLGFHKLKSKLLNYFKSNDTHKVT
tara:strand:- start:564 stop:956 length:393 start_codon:yes stop_codon:yes gene_type:complete